MTKKINKTLAVLNRLTILSIAVTGQLMLYKGYIFDKHDIPYRTVKVGKNTVKDILKLL